METQRQRKELQDLRRDLHRHPECGWLTFRTSILAAERLEQAGFTVYIGEEILSAGRAIDPPSEAEVDAARARCRQELGDDSGLWEKWEKRMGNLGGVIAVFDSQKPGPSVGCRFDMDALPIAESTAEERLPVRENFVSLHSGSSHTCGHDGHTAVGLMTALRLMDERERLCGKLILIFQPAEEGVRGAKSYSENWHFGRLDVFLAGHIGFTGEDQFVAGAQRFLSTTKTDGVLIGKSAHAGAAPERGRNALVALAEAIVRMQEIPKPAHGTARLNVGTVQAGEARNTIPARACFRMETRGSDSEVASYMQREAERILGECAAKYGVQCSLQVKGGCVCADSSEALSRQICAIAEKTGLYANCSVHQDFGASDDATMFMRMTQEAGGQAAYMLFGCQQSGAHHENGFDFDEDVLERSCEIWTRVVREVMQEKRT